MAKNFSFILIIISTVIFIQCKREGLKTNPKITHLSDFQSADGRVSLNITGGKMPYTISWSDGKSDSVHANLKAGTYYVTVTDARNRKLVDTLTVNQPAWPVCTDKQGHTYKTAIFGDQIWMIENLRATVNPNGDEISSVAVESHDSAHVNYGRLYSWNVAMNDSTNQGAQGICPDGWHIPTDKEWSELIDNISSFDQEIPDLETKLDLTYPGFYNGQVLNTDGSVSYWSSTQTGNNVWKRYFNKHLSKAYRYHELKSNAISVRCIKD